MKIKKGASLQGLSIKMRPVLLASDKIWKENGQESVVTAGTDGEHSAGSLHYYGYAVDLRTRYFDKITVQGVAELLKKKLSTDYNVVIHKTHIHIEYDKAKEL